MTPLVLLVCTEAELYPLKLPLIVPDQGDSLWSSPSSLFYHKAASSFPLPFPVEQGKFMALTHKVHSRHLSVMVEGGLQNLQLLPPQTPVMTRIIGAFESSRLRALPKKF